MIHLFPNGQVEVAASSGKIRYRWSPAYSQVSKSGVSIPLTRWHWQDIARRDGEKCVFHKDQATAGHAL